MNLFNIVKANLQGEKDSHLIKRSYNPHEPEAQITDTYPGDHIGLPV